MFLDEVQHYLTLLILELLETRGNPIKGLLGLLVDESVLVLQVPEVKSLAVLLIELEYEQWHPGTGDL